MATTSQLSRKHRISVLLVCSMSLFMVGLDITAVNVALPSVGEELHASLSWLQWTVSAYTVVMASLLLFSGSMADRLGRKRTFVIGLGVFSLASLLCSLAPTVELLVAFRVLQGIGASMLNPVAMAIITNTFTEPRERAQAVGVWGAVFGASMALGPIIGGALVSSAGWRVDLPDQPPARPGRDGADPPLRSGVQGAEAAPDRSGRPDPGRRASGLGHVRDHRGAERRLDLAADPGGLRRRRRRPAGPAALRAAPAGAADRPPLLPLDPVLVLDRAVGGRVRLVRRLPLPQHALPAGPRGLSPLEAGIAIVPIALMTMILSPISGRMVGRSGPRTPLVIAGVASFAACLMLVDIGPETPFAWLIAAYVVFGIGFGFVNAPITNAAVSGMPREQAGVAAAIATTSRQFGQAIGVAIVGAIVASAPAVRPPPGSRRPSIPPGGP